MKAFEGTLLQRETAAPSSWSFDSTFDFTTSLDYAAAADVDGKFIFILAPENKNSWSFDRYARVVVDQPLVLQLSLSAVFSQGFFADASASTVLLSNSFDLAGMMFAMSARSLTGGTEAISSYREGSSDRTEYRVSAHGNRDGVSFDIHLTPKDPGNPETVEFRWFLDYESKLHQFGSNRLTVAKNESGTIHESFTVTIVPEPSALLLLAVGTTGACLLRPRRR